jgi:hypothetical protein
MVDGRVLAQVCYSHRVTVLARADALRRAADELLRETGVVDVFGRLGTVHPVGSYRLNVMYRPDIDLIVTADYLRRDNAISVTKRLLDLGHFQTVGFADWVSHENPDAAKSYYWELRAIREDAWWKLDVWYTSPADDRSIEPTERFARLLQGNPAAREVILRIKAHFFDGTKYRDGVTGFAIYDAVLNHGRMTVQSFLRAWNTEHATGGASRGGYHIE